MASKPERLYWDACAWIGLVNEEADKITALRLVWEAAQKGHFELWTSSYIYLEFIKGAVPHGQAYTAEEHDTSVENILSQPFVRRVQLDIPIAKSARKLRRDLNKDGLKKRPDAIHLATALFYNAKELHTYDQSDLLQFDGKLTCRSGSLLKITKPDPLHFGKNLFTQEASREVANDEA